MEPREALFISMVVLNCHFDGFNMFKFVHSQESCVSLVINSFSIHLCRRVQFSPTIRRVNPSVLACMDCLAYLNKKRYILKYFIFFGDLLL